MTSYVANNTHSAPMTTGGAEFTSSSISSSYYPGSTHLRARHFFNAVEHADRVVQACAWDDNGAEFVFGDGTVLSFADSMNTFVALSPLMEDGEMSRKQDQRLMNPTHPHGGDAENGKKDSTFFPSHSTAQRDVLAGRDMFFTVWTLSKYAEKVKNALHLYNSYSPHPRLILGLTKTPCHLWRSRSPMNLLLLAKSRAHFERRRVFARFATPSTTTMPRGEGEKVREGREALAVVGVQLTLWCLLRRVSLTLHVGRATFSVRWPAPVSRPSGAPPIFVSTAQLLAEGEGGGEREMEGPGMEGNFAASSLPIHRAAPFVWVEQSFPVAQPPPPWAEMLRICIELDEEVPPDECFHGAEIDDDDRGAGVEEEAGQGRPSLDLELPTTAVSSHHACRFSRAKPGHRAPLVAAGRHVQWAACNREIHGCTARVRWRVDADCTGREPHAVFWCLNSREMEPNDEDDAPNDAQNGAVVLAVVREDHSVVWTALQRRGYALRHLRCDGSLRSYHISADGEISLPPVVGPLLLASKGKDVGGEGYDAPPSEEKAEDGERNTYAVFSSDVLSIFVEDSCRRRAGPHPFVGMTGELADTPLLAQGRYLIPLGNAVIQLSQCNLAASRAAAEGGVEKALAVYRRAHPTTARAEAILAEATDASAFRTLPGPYPALSSAAADGSVVLLATHLEGVGSFTALTNGVVRCLFDDRTILHLIPGVDDFDVGGLLAACLFRDARRCTMRAASCPPQHAMAPYLAYALPFREEALLRATSGPPRPRVSPRGKKGKGKKGRGGRGKGGGGTGRPRPPPPRSRSRRAPRRGRRGRGGGGWIARTTRPRSTADCSHCSRRARSSSG